MAEVDKKSDPTLAEEAWSPRKLTALAVVTILIVLAILYTISP